MANIREPLVYENDVEWPVMKMLSAPGQKIDWLQEECPIKATIDVIRGRWKPSILHALLPHKKRFSELQKEIPHVTAQTLTLQLRQLEADGIITRQVYAEVPARVEYALSDYGQTLSALLEELCAWGESYLEHRRMNSSPE